MDVKERMRRVRLIEKLEVNNTYAIVLGVTNISTFKGKPVAGYKNKEL